MKKRSKSRLLQAFEGHTPSHTLNVLIHIALDCLLTHHLAQSRVCYIRYGRTPAPMRDIVSYIYYILKKNSKKERNTSLLLKL